MIDERQQLGWVRYSWWRVLGLSLGFLVLIGALFVVAAVLIPKLLVGRSLA